MGTLVELKEAMKELRLKDIFSKPILTVTREDFQFAEDCGRDADLYIQLSMYLKAQVIGGNLDAVEGSRLLRRYILEIWGGGKG